MLLIVGLFFGVLVRLWRRSRRESPPRSMTWFFTLGGELRAGLASNSVVLLWLGPHVILAACLMGFFFGISGVFWFSLLGGVQMMIFAALAASFKHYAPKVASFPQYIRERFGHRTHLLVAVAGCIGTLWYGTLTTMCAARALKAVCGFDLQCAGLAAVFVVAVAYWLVSSPGLRGNVLLHYVQLVALGLMLMVAAFFFYMRYGDAGMYEHLAFVEGKARSLRLSGGKPLLWALAFHLWNLGPLIVGQVLWQRVVACKRASVGMAFVGSAVAVMGFPLVLGTAFGLGACIAREMPDVSLAAGSVFELSKAPLTGLISREFGWIGRYLLLVALTITATACASATILGVSSLLVSDVYAARVSPGAAYGKSRSVARASTVGCACLLAVLAYLLTRFDFPPVYLWIAQCLVLMPAVVPIAAVVLFGRATVLSTALGLAAGALSGCAVAGSIAARYGDALVDHAARAPGELLLIPVSSLAAAAVFSLGLPALSGARDWLRGPDRLHRLSSALVKSTVGLIPQAEGTYADIASLTLETDPRKIDEINRRASKAATAIAVLIALAAAVLLSLRTLTFGEASFSVWTIIGLVWLTVAVGLLMLSPIAALLQPDRS